MHEVHHGRGRSLCVAALLVAASAGAAQAHKTPRPIAIWGGFPDPSAARCQRVIGAVAAHCGLTVWSVRNACLAAQIRGEPCDVSAADAAVIQAHQDAIDIADRACGDADLSELYFSLTLDVNADIDTFCNQLENAAVSAVYGPALRGITIHTVDEPTRACIAATARATTAMLRVAFRTIRQTLDRIACRDFPPSVKMTQIDRAVAHIAHLQTAIEGQLAAACATFTSTYHRDADTFLTTISQRGDCLGGGTYVQDRLTCPLPVCGNGIREGTEQCDDGNLVVGDGCSSSCIVEP